MYAVLAKLSSGYPPRKGILPKLYSPVRHFTHIATFTYDLHVLGTPPAFILSQNQTLKRITYIYSAHRTPTMRCPIGVNRIGLIYCVSA